MKQLLSNPTVRLAGRALVAAGIAAVTQIHASDGKVAWTALAVGSGLVFCEVFTPLNALVGYFKPKVKP
jgi:hypothetical protein